MQKGKDITVLLSCLIIRVNRDLIFTCEVVVRYNFSDGDQLPILRERLEKPPGSNISLLRMTSSVGK